MILRQGKSHPLWREAAWHLMEYAGKDTQLLLEAQRDLIEQTLTKEPSSLYKKLIVVSIGLGILVTLGVLIWKAVEHFKRVC